MAYSTNGYHILLVEDDARFARRLKTNLVQEGYQVTAVACAREAIRCIEQNSYQLVLTDIKMPGMTGLELLKYLKEDPALEPDLPVVMLTSIDAVDTAVESMRLGALDYLTKDADRAEIIQRIKRSISEARVRRENRELRAQLQAQSEDVELVAISPAMQALLAELRELAQTPVTLLIQGETGVGKEVVARTVHRFSQPPSDKWVAINCAALPGDDKFQSELFGHEKGSFTGADERKHGQFEKVENGTLFLDEIGELSLESQAKLLRVLETREFTRMGGSQVLRLNARVIVASNRDLRQQVEKGLFRQDLFFRISVAPIKVPPLRIRVEDIKPLAETMLAQLAHRYAKPPRRFSNAALAKLRGYAWPGNVRELRNVVEGLLIRGRTGEINADEIRLEGPVSNSPDQPLKLPPEGMSLDEIEKSAVEQALHMTNHNQSAAARLLHISPDRLAARARKYKLLSDNPGAT